MGRRQPNFKSYYQQQLMLLPPSLQDLVPRGHVVRVDNDVISKINLEPFNAAYYMTGPCIYARMLVMLFTSPDTFIRR